MEHDDSSAYSYSHANCHSYPNARTAYANSDLTAWRSYSNANTDPSTSYAYAYSS